ncbi:MAG: isochorismatase family protein [Alphaproteobacteria bacterium]|nr:isochorismatase family protein [Alphaproteobacteria bacterium]
MTDVYAKRGYGAVPVGFGAKPAVVVIDFQRGFTGKDFAMGGSPMVDAAVETSTGVIAAAKSAGAPVIACVMGFESPASAPHWKVGPVLDLITGTPSCELDPRIAAEKPDVVLTKTAPSLFFGTPAGAILTRNRVDTVIVTGCITSGCVRASIIDAFSLGFRVLVPRDCVGDHDLAAHEQNLADVGRRYCDIIDAREAIAGLESWRSRNDQ